MFINIFRDKEDKEPEKAEFVQCDECSCIIEKKDAQIIKVISLFSTVRFYCQAHSKPYDELWAITETTKYFGRIEMDEKGEPVGYKKIKE